VVAVATLRIDEEKAVDRVSSVFDIQRLRWTNGALG